MEIREVRVSDAASMVQLMDQLANESKFMMFEPAERNVTAEEQAKIIESFTGNNSKSMFVLADESGVHGFVVGVGNSANRNKHSMHCVIGIKQSNAGKGYGKSLLRQLETWAAEHHFTRMELTVMCHNERAYNLYLSHGFEVEGVKRKSLKVDGQYVDEYYMSKISGT